MSELVHPKLVARSYRHKCALVIWIVLSILCLSTAVLGLFDVVIVSGNHCTPYPGKNLVADYLSGVAWAAILGVSILFWPICSGDKKALTRIWLIKAVVALVLMLGYEYKYYLDPDGYYGNAIMPGFVWKGFAFGNGTYTIRQLTWLHLKIIPDSFHAAKVGFAMIGLVAVYLVYRAAVLFLRRGDTRILYVLALFPGVLFWSSTLGKDPIVLLGVSLYAYGVVAWYCLKQWRHLVTLAAGVLIVSLVRLWVAPIMVAPLFVFVVLGRRSLMWRMASMAICLLVFALVVPRIQSLWRMSTIEDLFAFRSYGTGAFTGGGSSVAPPAITGLHDLVRFLPMGVFTALFRPLPWEVPNLFGFFQGSDGLVLLVLLALAVRRTRLGELTGPLVLWAISLIVTWAGFYGLVTYNLGALVRYRLQILPIMLAVLLYLSRRRTGRAIPWAEGNL